MGQRLHIVSTTTTYPTRQQPQRGAFVQRRLAAMARHVDLQVIAPRPWFPGIRSDDGGKWTDRETFPPERRPRMFYLPGILKWSDPHFFSRVLDRELRGLMARRRPDLLDVHFEWPDAVGAARSARRLAVPFVVTLRGKIVSQSRHPLRRRMMRRMLRAADACIAVSNDLAQRAVQLAGDGRPVFVIPNGVDVATFRPIDRQEARRQLGLDPAARWIISVGWQQALKGFDRLVALLPRIRAAAGDIRLILVGGPAGEPDYERALQRGIDETGMRPFVELRTDATPATIATLLNAANLFALATRSEGWCNAIHESLACGTPIVATDVGGNRELVRGDRDGFLVPRGAWDAMADAMVAELSHPRQRERIGEGLATRTWDDAAREVLAVFHQTLERRCIPRSSDR